MQRTKYVTWRTLAPALALALVLAPAAAGCRITATPAVRYRAATYGEPYVFYQSSTPYVYANGTVWNYDDYYVRYYGPTYTVPAPPRYEGPITSPPPPVIVGPAYGGGQWHGDR